MQSELLTEPAEESIIWDFTLFKTMTRSFDHRIRVNDLITSYEVIMDAYNISRMNSSLIEFYLNSIKVKSGKYITSTVGNEAVINYDSYQRSLKWYIRALKTYDFTVNGETISFNKMNVIKSHKILILTSILDILMNMIVFFIGGMVPMRILFARSSAVVILTNMAYILISCIDLFAYIPDYVIVNLFDIQRSSFYHRIFGIKIFVASTIHIIAHVLHVHFVLGACKTGCTKEFVRIVKSDDRNVVISPAYFMKHYSYVTGGLLALVMICQMITMFLNKKRYLRYATNQLIHKYCAIIFFTMTILHGVIHLIGFNYSYVFVLPLLLVYFWHHRSEVITKPISINRWTVSNSVIKLYLDDSAIVNGYLESFNNISVYVNHPKISKLEWHPFTLSRGYKQTDATVSIKRTGAWTNKLASLLLENQQASRSLCLGHIKRSKFRFHRLYENRYVFCAGIGITGFTSIIHDMKRNPVRHKTKTTLVWSISELALYQEYTDYLLELSKTIPNLSIKIFYSNRAVNTKPVTNEDYDRFKYLQSLIFGFHCIDIITSKDCPIVCRLQRAPFTDILVHAVSTDSSNQSTIGVFACGSKGYVDQLSNAIRYANKNDKGISCCSWMEYA